MIQKEIDEEAIDSLRRDLPGGLLFVALEISAAIGFVALGLWLFGRF